MTTQAVLNERNAIDAAVEGKTIIDVFNHNATAHPDRAAIYWKAGEVWRHLTWSQYRKLVHEAAAGMLTLGVSPGDFVAIMAGNRPEHVVADLAALHDGAAGVTLYSTLAQNQIQYIASNCSAKVAVLEDLTFMKRWEAIRDDLPDLRYVILLEGADNYDTVDWVISWDQLLERGRAKLAEDPEVVNRIAAGSLPETLATLIYTSGTTGVPKGVMITHRNVIWTTECLRRAVDLAPHPRMVSYLPLAHIAERAATHYLGIYMAGEVYYCPDMTNVLDYMLKARPTIFVAVPRVWEKLHTRLRGRFAEDPRKARLINAALNSSLANLQLEQEGRRPGLLARIKQGLFDRVVFSKVRDGVGLDQTTVAITAAAPINPDLIRFFRALGVPLHELYGMTESTGPATTNLPGADRIGTVGKALPGVEVALAEDGEILMRGGVVTAGYYKLLDESAETFDPEGWLHSGDLGRFDEDGFLHIVGRKKDIIITAAGKNVAPAKLEGVLKKDSLIAQACMVGDQRQFLTMVIALDPEEAPTWAADHGIEYTDLASFSRHPQVQAEVQRLVDAANETVARVEQIKKFVVVPDVWTPDTGELTPSLKLKRQVVLDKYADDIEALYS